MWYYSRSQKEHESTVSFSGKKKKKKGEHPSRITDKSTKCTASAFPSFHPFCCSNGFSFGYCPSKTCGLLAEIPEDQKSKMHNLQGKAEQIGVANCKSLQVY